MLKNQIIVILYCSLIAVSVVASSVSPKQHGTSNDVHEDGYAVEVFIVGGRANWLRRQEERKENLAARVVAEQPVRGEQQQNLKTTWCWQRWINSFVCNTMEKFEKSAAR